MIREEIVSKRYADAFLAHAKGTIGFEKGLAELQDAKRVIRDNPDLASFLKSLEFTNTEKFEVIDAIFKESVSDETANFLKLLIEKRRIDLLVDIAEYARVHYAHGVETDAVLSTSYPVDTDSILQIKTSLEARTKKQLHLYMKLDADLLGGARAQIGNIIIDGSVRKRLEDMRDKLLALKVAGYGTQTG